MFTISNNGFKNLGAKYNRRTNNMRTIRTKVYKFNELNKTSKENAIEKYRNENDEIFWADENKESMLAFAALFPITIKDWSYGGRGEGVYFSFDETDEIENLNGQRLATYLWNNYKDKIYSKKYYSGTICSKPNKYYLTNKNAPEFTTWHRYSKIQIESYNCPFTGYCMDNEILDPMYKFIDKPDSRINFKELLNDCFEAWIKACNEDIDDQNSDDYISDQLVSNDYEFTQDGRRI